MSDQQERIAAGDARRGRIHPGEFASRASGSYTKLGRAAAAAHAHGDPERTDHVAGILGGRLQLHETKGHFTRAAQGGAKKGSPAHGTQQALHGLAYLRDEDATRLRAQGTTIHLHDAKAGKVLADMNGRATGTGEALGFYVHGVGGKAGEVHVGPHFDAAHTVVHEVGHALLVPAAARASNEDLKYLDTLARSPRKLPSYIAEHLAGYHDEIDKTDELLAEMFVMDRMYDPDWLEDEMPRKAVSIYRKLLADELAQKIVGARRERTEPIVDVSLPTYPDEPEGAAMGHEDASESNAGSSDAGTDPAGAMNAEGSDAEYDDVDDAAVNADDNTGPNAGSGQMLDELYAQLGRAHAVGEDLDEQDRQALAQIDAEEKRLTSEREESEQAGDTARVQAIDDDLEQLRQAYLTIKDRLGADEQQDEQRQPGERHGDGGDRGAGPGPQAARPAARRDG